MRKFFDYFGVGDEWREVCAYFARLLWWERVIYVWTMVSVLARLCLGDVDAAWPWVPLNCLLSLVGFIVVQMRHEDDGKGDDLEE